mgnify:CR=1 FL=1
MKILVNKKIKSLFCKITACIMLFTLSATLLTIFEIRPTVLVIFLCMIGMGIAIVVFCYGYFKEQNEIMETAVAQITEYISGNHKAALTVMRKERCIVFSMR